MGTLTVPIQIGDLAGQNFMDLEALVDTTTYTVLPKEALDQLGIEQEGQRSFDLGDDQLVEYPVAYARMCLEGREIVGMVVFVPDNTAPLLGATALETASLAVDTIHQRLIPVPALLR